MTDARTLLEEALWEMWQVPPGSLAAQGYVEDFLATPSGRALLARADEAIALAARVASLGGALRDLLQHHGSVDCMDEDNPWPDECDQAHESAHAALAPIPATDEARLTRLEPEYVVGFDAASGFDTTVVMRRHPDGTMEVESVDFTPTEPAS